MICKFALALQFLERSIEKFLILKPALFMPWQIDKLCNNILYPAFLARKLAQSSRRWEHNERNVNVTENGKLICLFDKAIYPFGEGNLPVCAFFYFLDLQLINFPWDFPLGRVHKHLRNSTGPRCHSGRVWFRVRQRLLDCEEFLGKELGREGFHQTAEEHWRGFDGNVRYSDGGIIPCKEGFQPSKPWAFSPIPCEASYRVL